MIVAIDPVQLAKPAGGQWRPHEFYAGALRLVEVEKAVYLARAVAITAPTSMTKSDTTKSAAPTSSDPFGNRIEMIEPL